MRVATGPLLAAALMLMPAAASPGAGQPASSGPGRCAVAAELRGFAQDLPRARAALHEGRTLTIVALGSSSTQGVGASSDQTAYPAVLEAELSRLLPGHAVKVVNAGVGGNSVLQMLHRMQDDVLSETPDLVVWQTGVNDAIHDIGLDKFRRILRKGIAKLGEAGVDVVIMDQQPVPRAERYPLYADYLAALREVAAETGTPVFRRYDVMRTLIAEGRLREDEIFSADSLHMVDGGYFCLGQTLARTLAEKLSPRAAGVAPR